MLWLITFPLLVTACAVGNDTLKKHSFRGIAWIVGIITSALTIFGAFENFYFVTIRVSLYWMFAWLLGTGIRLLIKKVK